MELNKKPCFFCGVPTENLHDYNHFNAAFCNVNHQVAWHYKMAQPLLISGNPGSSNSRLSVVLHQSDEFNSFPKLSQNVFNFLKNHLSEYGWIMEKGSGEEGDVHIYLGITSTVRIAKEIASRKSYLNYLNKMESLRQNPIVLAARVGENNAVLLRGMGNADPVYPLDYDTSHSILEDSSNYEIVDLLRKRINSIQVTTSPITKTTTVSGPHQKSKRNNKIVVLFLSNDLANYLGKLKSNVFSYLRSNLPGLEWIEHDRQKSDPDGARRIFVTTLSTPRVQKEITSKSDYIEYEKLTDSPVILALVIGSDDSKPFNLSTHNSYGKIHQLTYNVDHQILHSPHNNSTLEELQIRFM